MTVTKNNKSVAHFDILVTHTWIWLKKIYFLYYVGVTIIEKKDYLT